MADISMCDNETCPLKKKCYRHEAIPTIPMWQSYGSFVYDEKKEECEDYWPLTNEIPSSKSKKNDKKKIK